MSKHVFLNRAVANLSVGDFHFKRNRCELDSEEQVADLQRLISQLPLSQQHEFAYLPPNKSVEEAILESTLAIINGDADPNSPEAQAVAAALKARIDAEVQQKQLVSDGEQSMLTPLKADSAKLISDSVKIGAVKTTSQGAATTSTIADKPVDATKQTS